MSTPKIRSLSVSSQESYSAVMITDLVADVPIDPETVKSAEKPVKEENNLAYDRYLDGETKSPVTDGVAPTSSPITNGGGIGRGVILNAVQFGQPDIKAKSEEKSIQMSATLPVPALPQQISESKGFKDMSFSRKVAFVFSFLPSVLFVLCFAVILPCIPPKPCVEEVWMKTYNNTEQLSRLQISQNVMFTAFMENRSVLIKLNKDSGEEGKTLEFDTNSAYLVCGKIVTKDSPDCMVMNGEGKFYTLNDSHSTLVWNPISEDEMASDPILLPDCNGDGTEEIALAVSNTKIKIMYSVTTASTLNVANCDTVPKQLMPWTVNGSAALVFTCRKDGEDKLVKIPHGMWCPYDKDTEYEAVILHKGEMDSLNAANILPLEDGLVLWSKDEISMILPNGSKSWTFSNESHAEENRFMLYGNFRGENKQVAILSSTISSGFKVTFLDPSNGNLMKSMNFKDFEATDVVTVPTENKDFIVFLKKKTEKPKDILSTALTQIQDFSTTMVNLLSNEEIRNYTKLPSTQEVSFLDTDGTPVSLKELVDLQNAEYKTTITAVYDEKKDVLHIYLLSTSENNVTNNTTKVRSISVAHWKDSKHSRCIKTQ